MAATQAETQRGDAGGDQPSAEQSADPRGLLQNGTDKAGRAADGVSNAKSESPEAPPSDQFGYRYSEGDYYGPRGFPGKARPPPQQQQRFFPGQAVSQAPGPTPTLNSLLQASGAPHRYPNSYEPGYPPAPPPAWPPRAMPPAPYNPQPQPYRNSTVSVH